MNTSRKSAILLAVLGAFFFCPAACEASSINIDLVQATQTGAPGITLVFSGVLTNTTASTIFLNSAGINLSGGFSPGDIDTTPFLINAPLSLTGLEASLAVDLFTVAIPNPFADGLYGGTLTVLGGADANAQDILGTASFFAGVAATDTPEPGTMLTAGAMLAAMAGCFWKRSRPGTI